MKNSKTRFRLFLVSVGGAIVGATVGLLYAPERGDITRARLRAKADKASVDLENSFEQGGDRFGRLIGSILGYTSNIFREVIEGLEKEIKKL